MSRTAARRTAPSALALAVVLALAACGGSEGTAPDASTAAGASPAATPTFSKADVAFATDMIPHHRQAVEMADLAATRAGAEVKALAATIRGAQQPEIDQLSGWLRTWGEPVPSAVPSVDHSGHAGMPGMMSPADMRKLAALRGTAFDRQFLTMMIAHHEGAVEMAGKEKAAGANPQARAMAATIADTQLAEIATMRQLRDRRS